MEREVAVNMPADLQNRTQYLALAEFCQEIISPLFDYIDGVGALPDTLLRDALTALKAVRSGSPYRFGQRPAAALASYEQVRTLEEVWRTPQQVDEVINITTEVLREAGARADRAKSEKLIALFSKLQARALWNFEQPKRTAPPDVAELCKALNQA